MRILGFALSTLVLVCASDLSSQKPVEQDEQKCCCTTVDTGQCLIKVRSRVDKELNEIYQKAMTGQDEKGKTLLRKAQRSWISYRDADCEGEQHTYEGGSMAGNMGAFCEIRLTRQRIAEINYVYLDEH